METLKFIPLAEGSCHSAVIQDAVSDERERSSVMQPTMVTGTVAFWEKSVSHIVSR